jgi:hypothetical protein
LTKLKPVSLFMKGKKINSENSHDLWWTDCITGKTDESTKPILDLFQALPVKHTGRAKKYNGIKKLLDVYLEVTYHFEELQHIMHFVNSEDYHCSSCCILHAGYWWWVACF